MEPLKNKFFQPSFIHALSTELGSAYPLFNKARFRQRVVATGWKQLELKGRMHRIADEMYAALPFDYSKSLKILLKVAPRFTGFDAMVFPDFVERYGLDHFETSLNALASFTVLCSSEFAVRPFIEKNPAWAFEQLNVWAQSENEHLRRLASEGCRPRLPWAGPLRFLVAEPSPILPILEQLKSDPSQYVRKSVANNLNDISKDHPDLLISIVKKWKSKDPRTQWILKHASRTLLKQGRPDVLVLFGFNSPKSIRCSPISFSTSTVRVGDAVTFTCKLSTTNSKLGKIRIEYVVDYVKANGNVSAKVFQISEKLESSSTLTIQKQHSFKERTTRQHYPGAHRFSVRVNGVEKAFGQITLKKSNP